MPALREAANPLLALRSAWPGPPAVLPPQDTQAGRRLGRGLRGLPRLWELREGASCRARVQKTVWPVARSHGWPLRAVPMARTTDQPFSCPVPGLAAQHLLAVSEWQQSLPPALPAPPGYGGTGPSAFSFSLPPLVPQAPLDYKIVLTVIQGYTLQFGENRYPRLKNKNKNKKGKKEKRDNYSWCF